MAMTHNLMSSFEAKLNLIGSSAFSTGKLSRFVIQHLFFSFERGDVGSVSVVIPYFIELRQIFGFYLSKESK